MKNETSAIQFTIKPGTVYISTNPIQSSYADFMVTVANTSTEMIAINAFAITLPASLAPVNTLGSIAASSNVPDVWNFAASQTIAGEFDACPANGNNVNMLPNTSYQFFLNMVTLNSAAAPSSAEITGVVTFANGISNPPVPLYVAIEPAVPAITYFGSIPANINPNGTTTLYWDCEGIDYCTISPLGSDNLDSSGTLQVSPDTTITYTLYAYAAGVILSAQWQVSVANPAIVEFGGFEGQTSLYYGDTIKLVWECNEFTSSIKLTSNNGTYIPANLFTNGNTLYKGSVIVGPVTQPTIFTFTAYGSDIQNFVDQVAVISVDNVSATLTASPNNSLWVGDKVTLNWNVSGASAVSLTPPIENGPSLQNLVGSADFYPDITSTSQSFVLTATGYVNGNQQTITNLPPVNLEFENISISTFFLNPKVITPDGAPANQVAVAWGTQAQLTTIDNGIGQVSQEGVTVVLNPPNGTVYTLSAGTNQHPAIMTEQLTVVNTFGPYAFNSFATNSQYNYITNFAIPNPGPMSQLPQWLAGAYTIVLTGVVLTGNPPASIAGLVSYNMDYPEQSYFGVMGWPNYTDPLTFQWADPNNKTGTITLLVSLNQGGGGLEEFIKQ